MCFNFYKRQISEHRKKEGVNQLFRVTTCLNNTSVYLASLKSKSCLYKLCELVVPMLWLIANKIAGMIVVAFEHDGKWEIPGKFQNKLDRRGSSCHSRCQKSCKNNSIIRQIESGEYSRNFYNSSHEIIILLENFQQINNSSHWNKNYVGRFSENQ